MRFNPDHIRLEQQKPLLENNTLLKKLHEKTNKKLDAYRPDMKSFVGVYGEEKIQKDLEYVSEKEEQFKDSLEKKENADFLRREKKISDVFESILTDQFSGSWLNSKKVDAPHTVFCYPTNKFDDYRNGADMVLEILNNVKKESSHLGLSIDVTFSSDQTNLDEKMNRIIEEIKGGWKSEVKYFESDTTDYVGSVDIARSVIVVSRKTVEDLFKLELNSKRDELDAHPVQLSILAQVEEQAETFLALCIKYKDETKARIYREVLENIEYIRAEKRESFPDVQQDENALREQYEGLKLLHRSLVNNLV